MNESFQVYALYIWAGMGLVSAVICVLRVKRELELDSLVGTIVSPGPGPRPWHSMLRRNVVLPLLMAALAFVAWPIFLAKLAWDKGLNIAAWWSSRNQFKHAIRVQPDEKTLAVCSATGLRPISAARLMRSLPEELIQRLLDRHATRLSTQDYDPADPFPDGPIYDPFEDDPVMGPIISRVLEETERDLLAQDGRRIGLCHGIWHRTQERLLQEHSIVWYSPGQMNPGCRFD